MQIFLDCTSGFWTRLISYASGAGRSRNFRRTQTSHGTLSWACRNVYANQFFLNQHVFTQEKSATVTYPPLEYAGSDGDLSANQEGLICKATLPLQWNQASLLIPFTEGTAGRNFRQRLSTAGVGDILLVERTWLLDPERVKEAMFWWESD